MKKSMDKTVFSEIGPISIATFANFIWFFKESFFLIETFFIPFCYFWDKTMREWDDIERKCNNMKKSMEKTVFSEIGPISIATFLDFKWFFKDFFSYQNIVYPVLITIKP